MVKVTPPPARDGEPANESRLSRQKLKVYQDEAKDRQTSHWDWIYLSRAALSELATRSPDSTFARAPMVAATTEAVRPIVWLRLAGAALATLVLSVSLLVVA